MKSPFSNILRLSAGDFIAKTLYFFAFIFIARVLGVARFGTLEFALSIQAYALLLADGGLELWATREVAQSKPVETLIGRVLPLRLLLTAGAFLLILATIPFLPGFADLTPILLLFSLSLLPRAFNLKWIHLGQEQYGRVAMGLLAGQVVFAGAIFGFTRQPEQLIWVPIFWLVSETITSIYYFAQFLSAKHGPLARFTLHGAREIVRPAFIMGATQTLGILSFNFDTILLGFMADPTQIGWYRAAYKPITALLAIPITYHLGLFPALARTHSSDYADFKSLVVRSLRLTSIFAIPLAIGGTFLAAPIIELLYGPGYTPAIPAMQLLSWSACFVIIRGTFRQALIASGNQKLDFFSAGLAVLINIGMNLFLIPRYGFLGAALATVLSDGIWFLSVVIFVIRQVAAVKLMSILAYPLLAALVMGSMLYLLRPVFWPLQAAVGVATYFAVLVVVGEKEVRSWVRYLKPSTES